MENSTVVPDEGKFRPFFNKVERAENGGCASWDFFAIPDGTWEEGIAYGMKAISELAAMAKDDNWSSNTLSVIQDAAKATKSDRECRKAVANAFMHCLAEVFDVAARQGLVTAVVTEQANLQYEAAMDEARLNRDFALSALPQPKLAPEVKRTKRRAAKVQEVAA